MLLKIRSEAFLSVLFVFVGVLTALWPAWIEGLTGLDPDAGSGALEWTVVGLCLLCALGTMFHARRRYRLVRAAV
jgi:hypothetical protein